MPVTLLDFPLLAGTLLAWSLAAPPGPANALIAHDASRSGWLAGVATGLGAVSADLVMFLLMWVGVLPFIVHAPWATVALGVVGTGLMVKFAFGAWKAARKPVPTTAAGGYLRSFVLIMASPFNYAWWLSAGTTVFANMGVGLVLGFFGGLVLWVMFWSGLATAGAGRIRRFGEVVAYGSALVLAVFAGIIAWFTVQNALALL